MWLHFTYLPLIQLNYLHQHNPWRQLIEVQSERLPHEIEKAIAGKLERRSNQLERKKVNFGMWDFAGQEIYYTTHQVCCKLILSQRCGSVMKIKIHILRHIFVPCDDMIAFWTTFKTMACSRTRATSCKIMAAILDFKDSSPCFSYIKWLRFLNLLTGSVHGNIILQVLTVQISSCKRQKKIYRQSSLSFW